MGFPIGATERILHAVTEDDLVLEGVEMSPPGIQRPVAIVWVHGFTGRFSAQHIITIGRELTRAGMMFVSGNNRGHDVGTMIRRPNGESVLGGGAWELFEECPRDIAAWMRVAAEMSDRIVLVGHSLGALKAAYYQGNHQDPRVVGLAALSPPLRAHRIDPAVVAQAERMVSEGRGRDLLPWGTIPAGAGTVSAQTCVSWWRAPIDAFGHDTANAPIGRIRGPVFALFGTDEAWVGGPPDLEIIRARATSATSITTRTIVGANHIYTGYEAEVATAIADWVRDIGA